MLHIVLKKASHFIAFHERNKITKSTVNQEVKSLVTSTCNVKFIIHFYKIHKNLYTTLELSTIVADIINCPVKNANATFILDRGSSANLLNSITVKTLGMNWRKTFSSVEGLCQISQKVRDFAYLIISSRYDKGKIFSFKSLLVDKITNHLLIVVTGRS